MWARGRILLHLFASVVGQLVLIYPGERLMGAALLALNGMYFVFFFRNVRMAHELKSILMQSGDLPEDYDTRDDSSPVGSSYPWIFLGFPVLYVAQFFDAHLWSLVSWVVWFDLLRLMGQFTMVAVVHADLRHKLKMLTDPAYLERVVAAARAQQAREDRRGSG